MHFNYFFPGRRAVKLDDLLEIGLGYAFAPESGAAPQATFTCRGVTNGPGGHHGVVVSSSDEWIGYYQPSQTWQEQIGFDYWVGMWTEPGKRPTPATLARANVIEGGTLRLDDGQAWTIPKARHFDEFEDEIVVIPKLPARLTRDEQGNWIPGGVKTQYERLWNLTNAFIEAIVSDAETFEHYDELAIEAFACNYRVSAIEVDMLGIYDVMVRDRVIRILTDLEGWKQLQKKRLTRLASGSSSAGPNELKQDAETETTGRP